VDHPAGRKPEAGRRDGTTNGQPSRQLRPPQLAARLKEFRSRGPVDSAVHSPSTEQGRVGGVDDRVNAARGDVPVQNVDSHAASLAPERQQRQVRYLVAMDITAPETWGSAIYLWIVPIVLGDAIFPPIPSEMVVITGGALAADGHANFWLILFLAAFASWLGDMAVFALFRRRISHVLDRWSWGRRVHRGIHQAIAKAGRSSTYGAIIGARFIPGGRLATSSASGIANVSVRGFSLCAGLGAVLWAVWQVGLGYFTGSTTKLPFWASSLIGVGVGLVIGVVVGLIVTRRRGSRSPVDEPYDGDVPQPE
jgi:membrane-associated protein